MIRTALSHCVLWLCLVATPTLAQPGAPGDSPTAGDWQALIRQRVAAQDLPGALAVADERLSSSPEDLEARGWRARILGWLERWPESETEYRHVLEQAPGDLDVLTGLGRTLRALGRREEARETFRAALAIDPTNPEATAGLASLRDPLRHQLVVTGDADRFNYTPLGAQAFGASVRSDWTARWTTVSGLQFDHRSGLEAGRWSGAVAVRLSPRSSLTAGGSSGPDNPIVSTGEVFVDYGRAFSFGRQRFVSGIEMNVQPRWLWFTAAEVFTLTPTALLYLPRDWTAAVSVTAARSSFPGVGSEWRPSGAVRLAFPLSDRFVGHGLFVAGTENYALVDQIGRFSARTVGGGLRVHLADNRDVAGYVTYQARTQGRTQMSAGFGYAFRF